MSVFFITGKLGNGKTLAAIYQILQHLLRGVPVATNIDINLTKMLGSKIKNCLLYRLKDKPTISDLESIGDAYLDKNQKYNESKFGAIVFDECATWFNSRTWNDKDRQDLINALVHIRKKHWNVYFIVQDISVVDKQARELLGEHTVYMRRTDNIGIPFLTSLVKIFFGGLRLKMPKAFFGIVKYGTSHQSLKVDTWWFKGGGLYDMYDTEQIFSPIYDSETYCVLPPWHSTGRYQTIKNGRYYMKLTKIYLKKYSKILLASFGLLIGAIITSIAMSSYFDNKMDNYENNINQSMNNKTDELNQQIDTLKASKLELDNKISSISAANGDDASIDALSIDFIDKFFLTYKARLSGYVLINNKMYGYIDFYKDNKLFESFRFSQISGYDWTLSMKNDILTVSKNNKSYYVTSWINPLNNQIDYLNELPVETITSSSDSIPAERFLTLDKIKL